ncbi:MAG: hypothetical protein FJ301_07910 [Planctomycetes bacterium]|nr:hypothetical protein [Planctomycetota bacterium]
MARLSSPLCLPDTSAGVPATAAGFVVALLAASLPLAAQSLPDSLLLACARGGDNAGQLHDAWRNAPPAQRDSVAFLLTNMPLDDARTLDTAFLLREVRQAHEARAAVPWGASLDDALFANYVLPYAQANEAREDWRSDFAARFLPRVRDCRTPGEAAQKLNATIFGTLNVHYSTERKRADQAPSASIAQGKASCTGLSILLADACRACCVPARLVSVRWPHQPGNHTWVEVWDGAAWRYCGADEPDSAGLDRGWFTDAAAQAAAASDSAFHPWAVSFAATGQRFSAGWGRGVELHGTDEAARYAGKPAAAAVASSVAEAVAAADDALRAQFSRYFGADAARQATFEFDRNLDAMLAKPEGDARLRALAFAALRANERAALQADFDGKRVRAGDKASPYTWKVVGDKPAGGYGLVIAMHGGGGAPKRVNDSQWQHMQIYYRDHPEAGGYVYCALRAPTDEWNGFYTDYFYPLLEKLIRQFVICGEVDPDRVVALGYSHGGYGAFAIGPKLPHRFAAVHASAAAPTDGQTSAVGLHTLAFSSMVGDRDTAYGRRERCEGFARQIADLQQQHPGRYPARFDLIANNGHTGLPDRDLLARLVPLARAASPKWLQWQQTDGTVRDHYWLRDPSPQPGRRLGAEFAVDRLVVTGVGEAKVEAWLDARHCDLGKPLVVAVDGAERTVAPAPSARTLCRTLQERGDPALAASWVLPLR